MTRSSRKDSISIILVAPYNITRRVAVWALLLILYLYFVLHSAILLFANLFVESQTAMQDAFIRKSYAWKYLMKT